MPQEIHRNKLQTLMAAGAQLVEVLASSVYRKGHLPGAINIPLAEFDEVRLSKLDKQRSIIVYCQNRE